MIDGERKPGDGDGEIIIIIIIIINLFTVGGYNIAAYVHFVYKPI